MKRGFFITLEGGEGAGKSVQAKILARRLRKEGHAAVLTREPGGTRIGEQIRAITHDKENTDLDAVAEAYLMAASRAQHVRQIIAPALEAGKIVVCDRFVDSSLAYQGYGRKLGVDVVAGLNALAVYGAKQDLTILLDVSLEIGMKRRNKSHKPSDRLDLQQKEFYERVHQGYLALAKNEPTRYVVIDAAKSIEEVAAKIWSVVKSALQKNK